MATINLNNLHLAGADLFVDSESYLNQIANDEAANVDGGSFVAFGVSLAIGLFIGFEASRQTMA